MKANVKKAIKIIDVIIESHSRRALGIRNLCKEWPEDNNLKGLGLEIANVDDNVIKCINAVKECLEEEPKRRKIEKNRNK